MPLNDLLDPSSFVYVLGLILAMICTQIKHRRKMMLIKFLADYTNAYYMFLMGGLAGALSGFIAGTGGLVQAATPDKHLKKTIWPRIIGALSLSAISIYLSYHSPIDLLPMIAVVGCRLMELHHNPERIRLAYFLSGFLWIAYFLVSGIYLMVVTSAIMNVMFLLGLIRHRPRIAANIDPI
jgi:hypothetical protein